MGKTAVLLYVVLFAFSSCIVGEAWAQFSQLPVAHAGKGNTAGNARLKVQLEPLSLPFWDDFSSGSIDSLKWQNRGAVASLNIGMDPPSIGVVYLDGVDGQGKAYSAALLENGEGDQLLSQQIELSSYRPADSLYLSFFWQAGGKAEMPDENDQLELYFLNANGEWVQVWQTAGGGVSERDIFAHQMVWVEASFLHRQFQFKFVNRGRLSGPFDSWILDYIYLNKNRTVLDVHYEDRALTKNPTSVLGKYTAMPFWEWNRNQDRYSSAIHSQFKNLSGRFRAMEYTVLLRDKATKKLLRQIHSQTPFNPVPQALERRDFSSVALKTIDLDLKEEMDLETAIYLSTGDGFLVVDISAGDTLFSPQADFRVNDSAYHTLPLRDFLAYDNGSVDYAAGINQRSGMLALRYEVSMVAYLQGISINFANFSQSGSPLELMVWRDLDAEPVYRKEILIPDKEGLSDFSYFPLDTNLTVADTFYIGFTQFSNDFIHIGLDKSNDTAEEVFFNITGTWQQNEEVRGSLMMRPHLSQTAPLSPPIDEATTEVVVYPNPVVERLFVEGKINEIKVFDAYGRQIKVPVESFERGKILNFTGREKGVYVVRAWTDSKPNSIRILVK